MEQTIQSFSQARQIVHSCPDCALLTPVPTTVGTNPRGLGVNEVWQTDVTYVSSFGTLKYVLVSVDSYPKFFVISAHKGENARDVIKYMLRAIATLAVPKVVKTGDGSGYVSQLMRTFFHSWGMRHLTGIPHSSTGQAAVEHTQVLLRNMLLKQKRGNPLGITSGTNGQCNICFKSVKYFQI